MFVAVKDLMRGDVVVAKKRLDKLGADVREGTIGVVFEEQDAFGDGGGPMVRWVNMGACNVYDDQVELVSKRPERRKEE